MKNVTITHNTRPVQKKHRRLSSYIFCCGIFGIFTLAAVIMTTVAITLAVSGASDAQTPADLAPGQTVERVTIPPAACDLDVLDMTRKPTAFFALTSEQRTLIEQVVSAESRGEPYDGQAAVAQCILNACLKDDITPEQAIKKYKYTSARVEPTESVKKAVSAVFDRGDCITDEPIIYFYNPKMVTSEFHESQVFVIEIQNHKFFKEIE